MWGMSCVLYVGCVVYTIICVGCVVLVYTLICVLYTLIFCVQCVVYPLLWVGCVVYTMTEDEGVHYTLLPEEGGVHTTHPTLKRVACLGVVYTTLLCVMYTPVPSS